MGCKAAIKLVASADGQHLAIKALDELHNHEINPELFKNLFHQRQLGVSDKHNIASMLNVKANKKMIQQRIMSDTGKIVHLKDIHNIATQSKVINNDLSTLQNAVEYLKSTNGAFVKLVSDENNELRGLYFQDERMRSSFSSYPEFLCVDATYKVNDLRMPLYLLLIENGNGQSEIVGAWLVADETEQMIGDMMKIFKQQNEKWSEVKTIMTDKDFVEREVLRKEIPDASLRICLFHVLRTFRREITMDKMCITRQQRDTVLEILQSIVYSQTLDEYQKHKDALCGLNLDHVTNYFNRSWDGIKNQWVVGLSNTHGFGNRTNNRVESINQKIKQVVDKNAKFDLFARDFVAFLESHRVELNSKACKATTKVPVVYTTEEDSPDVEYRRVLTPYAYKLVKNQLNRSETLTVDVVDDHHICQQNRVTATSCPCAMHRQYILPCKHIFAFRRTFGMALFSEQLFVDRWTKKHYLDSCSYQNTTATVHRSESVHSNNPSSQQQRYKSAMHVAQKLASCVAESTGHIFNIRLEQMRDLLRSWERDVNVEISVVDTIENNASPVRQENAEEDNHSSTVLQDNTEEDNHSSTDRQDNTEEDNHSSTVRQDNTEEDNHSSTVRQDNTEEDNHSSTVRQDNTEEDNYSTTIREENTVVSTNTQLNEDQQTTMEQNISSIENISNITLPPKIKKRGRPKGSESTVIGLPKKRLKLNRKVPFDRKSSSEQSRIMLKWIVDASTVQELLQPGSTRKVTVNDLMHVTSQTINMSLTEIDTSVLTHYFEESAFTKLQDTIVEAKSRSWPCATCHESLDTRCIACDMCLSWQHYHCADITSKPKSKLWYCKLCS